MLRFIFRRIAWAVPMLLMVSTVIFGLNHCVNADLLHSEDASLQSAKNYKELLNNRRQTAGDLYLDKPAFYFTLSAAIFPDTFYRIFPPERQERLARLTAHCGNFALVRQFEDQSAQMADLLETLPDSFSDKTALRILANRIFRASEPAALSSLHFPDTFSRYPNLNTAATALNASASAIAQQAPLRTRLQPALYWNGSDNQYHYWLRAFSGGNFGLSKSAKPVWSYLWPALCQTLLLQITAYAIAFALGIPLGVWMARRKGARAERWSRRSLLWMYAMPTIWWGAMAMWLFATQGAGLPLPKVMGEVSAWRPADEGLGAWYFGHFPTLLLAALTIAIHPIALIAFQMRSAMLDVLGQDYIRTARAKGLPEKQVIWRHAFRNALFPIISLFGELLPALLAGSYILESIFLVRGGLGFKVINAFHQGDFSVIAMVVMVTAILSIGGNLLTDILYRLIDPRIRDKKST